MRNITADEKVEKDARQACGDITRRLVGEPAQARSYSLSQSTSYCCPPKAREEATDKAAGLYSSEEIADLPKGGTNTMLGCGDLVGAAKLQLREAALDRSGGDRDCSLAAEKVGPKARVIGLDMAPETIRFAQGNMEVLKDRILTIGLVGLAIWQFCLITVFLIDIFTR